MFKNTTFVTNRIQFMYVIEGEKKECINIVTGSRANKKLVNILI
jgi:hypothetical protein